MEPLDPERALRHEARNVLNALRLNMEAFVWSDTDADRLECLDAIERSAETGEEWVDRFEQHYGVAPPRGQG